MSLFKHTFPFVPTSLVGFWSHLHRRPRNGFILGAGEQAGRASVSYLSLEEPVRLSTQPQSWVASLSKTEPEAVPRWVGVVGFEAGRQFDPGLNRIPTQPDPLKFPSLLFGEYAAVVKVDYRGPTMTLFMDKKRGRKKFKASLRQIERAYVATLLGEKKNTPAPRSVSTPTLHKKFRVLPYAAFKKKVTSTQAAIRAGDIYQANVSLRFSRRFQKNPLQLYEALCHRNPSPYACLIKQSQGWVVSCSPELLVAVDGTKLSTRPIAGTRPRGSTPNQDRVYQGRLLLSPKERAEHIMLVDLERNDVGRVARPGSVRVVDRTAIERYSHVMHIVSQVEGRLAKNKTAWDALQAVFPGGTITGCPKIRCVDILSQLEPVARGPFFGSAGYFSWNGDAKFNILIRTAFIQNNKVAVQAGAGIVADSRPQREYREILAKARVLLESILSVS